MERYFLKVVSMRMPALHMITVFYGQHWRLRQSALVMLTRESQFVSDCPLYFLLTSQPDFKVFFQP